MTITDIVQTYLQTTNTAKEVGYQMGYFQFMGRLSRGIIFIT